MKKIALLSLAALALPTVALAQEGAPAAAAATTTTTTTAAPAMTAPATGGESYTIEGGKTVMVKDGVATIDGKPAPKGDWKAGDKTISVTDDKGTAMVK